MLYTINSLSGWINAAMVVELLPINFSAVVIALFRLIWIDDLNPCIIGWKIEMEPVKLGTFVYVDNGLLIALSFIDIICAPWKEEEFEINWFCAFTAFTCNTFNGPMAIVVANIIVIITIEEIIVKILYFIGEWQCPYLIKLVNFL